MYRVIIEEIDDAGMVISAVTEAIKADDGHGEDKYDLASVVYVALEKFTAGRLNLGEYLAAIISMADGNCVPKGAPDKEFYAMCKKADVFAVAMDEWRERMLKDSNGVSLAEHRRLAKQSQDDSSCCHDRPPKNIN